MTEYLTGTFIVILVIVALNFINLGKRFRSTSNVDNAKIQEVKELFELMQRLNEDGTDEDEIPEGYGEFGYELTNPIPVNTAFGSHTYLAKLKTMDNLKISYKRIGSFGSPVSDHPVDGYIITSDGKELTTLYFSCYHKKNSKKAPKNFKF